MLGLIPGRNRGGKEGGELITAIAFLLASR